MSFSPVLFSCTLKPRSDVVKALGLPKDAAPNPYTVSLDSVRCVIPKYEVSKVYLSADRGNGKRPPVCAAFCSLIQELFPPGSPVEPRLVGFGVEFFLQLVSTTMSMGPRPAPMSLWPSYAEYYSVEDLVLAGCPPELNLLSVMKHRLTPDSGEKLKAAVAAWKGPHLDLDLDLILVTDEAVRFGLL